jgi:hypothetical protein
MAHEDEYGAISRAANLRVLPVDRDNRTVDGSVRDRVSVVTAWPYPRIAGTVAEGACGHGGRTMKLVVGPRGAPWDS